MGLPGTSPVGLCIGMGVLDPPIPSMWGDWYLQFPIIGPIVLPSVIPAAGILILPGTIPSTPPPPYSIPMQALIGAELTNLSLLEIKWPNWLNMDARVPAVDAGFLFYVHNREAH